MGVGGSADGIGLAARFSDPSGVVISADGSFALEIDTQNHTIRMLAVATDAATTLAGTPAAAMGLAPARASLTRLASR